MDAQILPQLQKVAQKVDANPNSRDTIPGGKPRGACHDTMRSRVRRDGWSFFLVWVFFGMTQKREMQLRFSGLQKKASILLVAIAYTQFTPNQDTWA